MKEIPILFSTAMVQAILSGNKTQTRRVVKFPLKSPTHMASINDSDNPPPVEWCPNGQPSDLLWVREKQGYYQDNKALCPVFRTEISDNEVGFYKWRPSIHMPKEAARIWLKVKTVRVERLHDISEEDAKAEGILCYRDEFDGNRYRYKDYMADSSDYGHPDHDYPTVGIAKTSFCTLWESINGRESWDSNPWVWVVEFEVLSTTGKPELTITRADALAQGYELVHAPELDREFPNVSIDEIEDEEILRLKPKVCEKEPYKTNIEEGVAYYRNTILTLIP